MRFKRVASVSGVVVLASFGLAVAGTPAASAAVSCSGTVTFDHTYYSGGNPVVELTIYYNTSNGGTNSACLYHAGAYYGRSEPTSVTIYRCSQHSAPAGSSCSIAASSPTDSGNYPHQAGPVGVTGTANYCVDAVGHMDLVGGGSINVDSGTRGC